MNRQIMKSMDTGRIPVERLISLLQTFTLKHLAKALPDLLETADLESSSCREFLLAVLETEVVGRNERRRKRNYSAAHFPPNISDTYETSSIIFTTNKEIMDWAEMMGDSVLTTALLDRILHHANCYSFRGESFRLKHPDMFS